MAGGRRVAGVVDVSDGYAGASSACQARSAACARASGEPRNCVAVSEVAVLGWPVIVTPCMLDGQPADNPAAPTSAAPYGARLRQIGMTARSWIVAGWVFIAATAGLAIAAIVQALDAVTPRAVSRSFPAGSSLLRARRGG